MILMKKSIFSRGAAALAAVSMALASCTVSEPDMPKGNASDYKLTSLTAFGLTYMQFSYDKQNRITEIKVDREYICEIEYAGNSSNPSVITITENTERYDSNTDKETIVPESVTEMSNIRCNEQGYIIGHDTREVTYSYSSDYDWETGRYVETVNEYEETWTSTYEYDSNGYMLRYSDDETYTLNWRNGLLMSVDEGGSSTTSYEYSDVDNKLRLWDPHLEYFGPMGVTGFYGKAPAKFVKRQTISDEYGTEIQQFSYSVLDNGLVNMCRTLIDEEEAVVKYNYSKK